MVVGDFRMKGADLYSQRWNRQGNLLIHEDSYQIFEDWVMPILDQMLKEQQEASKAYPFLTSLLLAQPVQSLARHAQIVHVTCITLYLSQ